MLGVEHAHALTFWRLVRLDRGGSSGDDGGLVRRMAYGRIALVLRV